MKKHRIPVQKGSPQKQRRMMKNSDFQDLFNDNKSDERALAEFSERASYALIAANWALAHSPKIVAANIFWLLSLILAVAFLFVRGLRHFLNIKHNHVILDSEKDREDNYSDAGFNRTRYGKCSEKLYLWSNLLLAFSAIFFIVTCFFLLAPPG